MMLTDPVIGPAFGLKAFAFQSSFSICVYFFLRGYQTITVSRPFSFFYSFVSKPFPFTTFFTMEQLISIQNNSKSTCDDGTIDIEDFVQNKLRPFLHKFKHQLSTFDDPSIALQEFTLSKIRNAYEALEKFDTDIRPMVDEAIVASIQSAQQHRHAMVATFVQALEQAMHDLNEKFREIEALSDGYLEKKMEDTIDATMQQIEEVDGRICTAFEKAFQVRQKVGDKITEVAGIASGRMDSVKKAVADEARRLLLYDELPVEWRNNAVGGHLLSSSFNHM
jgi:adiponectin receptor